MLTTSIKDSGDKVPAFPDGPIQTANGVKEQRDVRATSHKQGS